MSTPDDLPPGFRESQLANHWSFAYSKGPTLLVHMSMDDVLLARRAVRGRGIDPAAVARLVEEREGAAIASLPRDVFEGDEVRQRHDEGDLAVFHCPIWTTAGRSGLVLHMACAEDPEWPSLNVWIERVVDGSGTVVLGPGSAPIPPEEPRPAEPVGDGSDPRLVRGRIAEHDRPSTVHRLVDAVHRAQGGVGRGLDLLDPDMAAVVLLAELASRVSGDGFTAPFSDMDLDDLPLRLAPAARRIGMPVLAAIFDDVAASLPEEARTDRAVREAYILDEVMEGPQEGAWEELEQRFDAIDPDIWDELLRFVESRPEVFFRPE